MRLCGPLLALVLALASLPAAAQTVPVGRDAVVFENSIGTGSVLKIVAQLREVGGRLAVCGASWPEGSNATLRSMRRKLLANKVVLVDGKTLPVGISGFAAYGSEDEMRAGGLACVVSRQPWQAGHAKAYLDLRVRSGQLRG